MQTNDEYPHSPTEDARFKVLGEYLGQRAIGTTKERGYKINFLNTTTIHTCPNLKVILRPILDLTQEEIIKILTIINDDCDYTIELIEDLKWICKIYKVTANYEDGPDHLFLESHQNTSRFSLSKGKEFLKSIELHIMSTEILLAYQYLKSVGIDMPHYLLDGHTLHESGLAVYAKDLDTIKISGGPRKIIQIKNRQGSIQYVYDYKPAINGITCSSNERDAMNFIDIEPVFKSVLEICKKDHLPENITVITDYYHGSN